MGYARFLWRLDLIKIWSSSISNFTLSQQFPKTPNSACLSSLRPFFNKNCNFYTKFTIVEPLLQKIATKIHVLLPLKLHKTPNFPGGFAPWTPIGP